MFLPASETSKTAGSKTAHVHICPPLSLSTLTPSFPSPSLPFICKCAIAHPTSGPMPTHTAGPSFNREGWSQERTGGT